MDKSFYKHKQAIGGDGAELTADVGIKGENLRVEAAVEMPMIKIVAPATVAVDNLLDKLKKAIPGTWDDKLINQFKEDYKKDLVTLIKAQV